MISYAFIFLILYALILSYASIIKSKVKFLNVSKRVYYETFLKIKSIINYILAYYN